MGLVSVPVSVSLCKVLLEAELVLRATPCAMQKPAAPEQELWKLPPSLPALGPPAVQTQICFAVLSR